MAHIFFVDVPACAVIFFSFARRGEGHNEPRGDGFRLVVHSRYFHQLPHGICGRSQRRAGDRFRRRGDGKILRLCVTRVLRRSSLALAEKRSYLRIALLFIGLELETIFACILPMLYFSSVLILFLLIFLFICFFGVCGHLRAYAC